MRAIFLPVLLCSFAMAQDAPAKRLAFEVASVKPGPLGSLMELFQSGRVHERIDSSRVDIAGYPLSTLIQLAWRLPMDQIAGPDWMMDLRFDVQAKLPEGASKDQVPEMMQTLLTERFRMTAHHDLRILPVYALTIAKGGPKLHESTPGGSSAKGCNGGFRKVCHDVTMSNLADLLTRASRMASMPGTSMPWALDRPVVEMTGLQGSYDFILENGRVGGGRGAPSESASDAAVVTAFDAVKTLGLKLEPTKHPYDFLVIDHIDRAPTDN